MEANFNEKCSIRHIVFIIIITVVRSSFSVRQSFISPEYNIHYFAQ